MSPGRRVASRTQFTTTPAPSPEAPESLLEVRNVSKAFGGLWVLRDVSLNAIRGKVTGLIGPNGSGKSTLFDIIGGFQKADRGRIEFDKTEIDGLPPYKIGHLGLLRTFQLSEGGERMTVLENLLAAVSGQGEHRLLRSMLRFRQVMRQESEYLKKAKDVIQVLGLRQQANEYAGNLSGGQRKLLDLGRVFMSGATLCLLDEPTAGVNPTLINTILDALKVMNRERGISLLVVEHNMRVVSEICDHVYVLDAGTVISDGPPAVVQNDEQVLEIYLGQDRASVE